VEGNGICEKLLSNRSKGEEMKTSRRIIVLLLVLGLIAGCAQGQKPADSVAGQGIVAMGAEGTHLSPVVDRILARKELVVGTAASMPPFNMMTKDDQIIGLDADLAQYISGAMGVKLTLKAMHFNDLIPALEAGKVDMILSGMTITPLRNLRVAFVGPYFVSGNSILLKKANVGSMKELSQINSPDKVLVALKGSTSQLFAEQFLPKAKLLLSDDFDQGLAMVKEDKAQALIADFPYCQIIVYRYPEAGLVTLNHPLFREPLGIAIPANDLLLVNWLQNFLNSMEKSGELKALEDKWVKDVSWLSRIR
jgi:polar amino acid transport system substrate-binding protein